MSPKKAFVMLASIFSFIPSNSGTTHRCINSINDIGILPIKQFVILCYRTASAWPLDRTLCLEKNEKKAILRHMLRRPHLHTRDPFFPLLVSSIEEIIIITNPLL